MLPATFVPGFHSAADAAEIKYTKLGNTDMELSNLSIGGCPLGKLYGELDSLESERMVLTALKKGLNYIDTAPYYGQGKSEKALGTILQAVPRKAFYIGTKVGRYGKEPRHMFDFSREKVLTSFQESLKLLQLEYVDIVQIHDVEFCASLDQIVQHTLPAVNEIKKSGRARYVGITGYNLGVLKRIVAMAPPGSIDCVLSYSRYTLFNKDLVDSAHFFVERGIGLINAAPIAMGLLAKAPSWHPAPNITRASVQQAARYAQDRGFTLAHLALKMCTHQSSFATCLNGTNSLAMLEQNVKAATEPTTEEEESLIKELEEKFFQGMSFSHWENLEVTQYWGEMEKNNWKQNLDL